MEELIAKAARQLAQSKYAVALTGAGMSTESGVPDFRGPDGVWTKNPEAERQAYESYYRFQRDPKAYWIERMTTVSWLKDMENARPNPGHMALAELEEMSILKSVITQNIDNLHQMAGIAAADVIELHGSNTYALCLDCARRYELGWVRAHFNETGGQAPAILPQARQQLARWRSALHVELPLTHDMDFDVVSGLELQGFDYRGRQPDGQAVSPFGNLHNDLHHSWIYVHYCISATLKCKPFRYHSSLCQKQKRPQDQPAGAFFTSWQNVRPSMFTGQGGLRKYP